jgi:hypothetical protein
VEGSRNFMIILNFVDLLKELRTVIINVSHRNLSSGTNSRTVCGIISPKKVTE